MKSLRRNLWVPLIAAAALGLLAACGYSTGAPAPAAPAAAPKGAAPTFTITSPAEGGTVPGSQVQVSVKVENFTIKSAGGANKSNEGHIHMTLDGGALSMVFGDSHSLSGVPAGKHTLVAELVNNDHSSFSPPLKKTVSFSTTASGPTGGAGAGGYGY
ncbi:MAG: hypothetical protein HYX88_02205 [Chloroflexi bacterium]|nr:hypothetical protein [Chloroflexota bacterium]